MTRQMTRQIGVFAVFLPCLVFFMSRTTRRGDGEHFRRFNQYGAMDRWAENTLLVGVCYLGEAVWADYQPLCELNETNVEKQLSPFGERRGRRWYGTKSRQRADGQEVLPVAASAPLLSIVIPFHDNGELTCQALYELVLDSSPFKTEVMLFDDGSGAI